MIFRVLQIAFYAQLSDINLFTMLYLV